MTLDHVRLLLDIYRVPDSDRTEILELVDQAGGSATADALAWIASDHFRKTTATILEDAGQSPRQVADQLGHPRPSMTQHVYLARGVKNRKLPPFWTPPSAT